MPGRRVMLANRAECTMNIANMRFVQNGAPGRAVKSRDCILIFLLHMRQFTQNPNRVLLKST